ncbi:hypothetical protein BJ742DRAFT_359703 [Cladochytrium replicatum]|nr:hypothetical protein BJ742DRAFT_359703 [Cladochytrium replicatum]
MNTEVWAAMKDLIEALEAEREQYSNLMKNIDFGFHEIGARWWQGALLGAMVGFFFAILGAAIAPSLLLDLCSNVRRRRYRVRREDTPCYHRLSRSRCYPLWCGRNCCWNCCSQRCWAGTFRLRVIITAAVMVSRYVQFVHERKSTEKRWSKLAGKAVKMAEVREASCESARPMNLTLNGDLDSHKLRVLERHEEVSNYRKILQCFNSTAIAVMSTKLNHLYYHETR